MFTWPPHIITNVNNYQKLMVCLLGTCVTSGDMDSICSITFILTGPGSKQAWSQIQTLTPKFEPRPHGPHGKKSEWNMPRLTLWLNMSPMSSSMFHLRKKKKKNFTGHAWNTCEPEQPLSEENKKRRQSKMSTRAQTIQGGLLSGSASPRLERMLASYLEPNLPACLYK